MGKKEKEEMNDGNAAEKKRNDWGLTCSAFERHVNTRARARAHPHVYVFFVARPFFEVCSCIFFI